MNIKKVTYLIAITALLSLGKVYAQNNVWKFSGYMPMGLYGSEAVVIDSTVYVLGGYSDSLQKTVNWIYTFNPFTNKWTYIGNMNKARRNFAAGRIGKKIYYSGGDETPGWDTTGILEVFDTETKTATNVLINRKFKRNSTTGLIIDSVFYMIGGYGNYLMFDNYLMGYDLKTGQFIKPINQPSHIDLAYDQVVTSINNNIYIFGGVSNTISRDIYRYNTKSRIIYKLNTRLTRPMAGGEIIFLSDSNKVMLIGGYNESNASLNNVDLISPIDTTSFEIKPLSQLFQRRKDFMTAKIKENLFVFGGRTSFDQMTRTIERYTTPTDINEETVNPSEFTLLQNYPNPFNPSTVIAYNLPARGDVVLQVFDILGCEVYKRELFNSDAGIGKVEFSGKGLNSGIYFYRITFRSEIKTYSETKKMMLIK